MNYFKEILGYAKPYKKWAVLNIISNVLFAFFSTLSFVSLMPVLQVLFQETEEVYNKPVWTDFTKTKEFVEGYVNYYVSEVAKNDQEQALILMIVLVISLFFLKNVFGYLGMYFLTFFRTGIMKDLRDDLYKKIVNLPVSYFSEKRKGDVISRATTDVIEIQSSFLSILELIVKEPLNIIFALAAMLMFSVKLTLFVLVFIPISGYIISLIGKRLKSKSERVQKEQGAVLSQLEETLGGLKVIKGFNAEERMQDSFEKTTSRFRRFTNSLDKRKSFASPVSEVLGIAVIGVLLWFGGRMVLVDGTIAGSTFITFMGLAYAILTPAKALSKASYGVKKGNAAAERVLQILHTENTIVDPTNPITIDCFKQGIDINNVTFAYEDENVLKNFSLHIPKGKSVALVGQSGSGKSTIANLLTRFYDVQEGTISMDGHDIKDLSLKSLRDQMALVTQDSILFNDTIAVNVALANKNASDEEIINALKIANAWEFVKDLPDGIHTNIGDSGGKLSGGQKQRLSIARAVLKNAPILVLDEATSALDTESERLVQDALEKVMKNRTSIVIAHRLSTIQNADNIVVMNKGEIAEQGTHAELIEMKGLYNGLVGMQSL
ncbi:ABC transporter ATP-binding protein [Nonlabens ulvanivorans]|uniref:ATP-binding cassette, subfamily B, MsbA n=2 Tax=Nonlabens ulvanivorans TaxID=906888 RepID=A0A084JWP7_NONUL|nr:ABC transporter transmembrane domain-containing protein [Nonlabens ulvanivorans]KEZ93381.1 antibiotic ABC transporter ATP-binding protein [Nonlabens ulvanivorans]PRX13966.1 ATP-binding cassette, subfamily B, MsbA [Nonlabens ulvanivorans]